MNNAQLTNLVAQQLHSLLKPKGYRKKGTTFVRDTGEILHLIGIQKSTSSTASYVKCTMNIGVESKLIDQLRGVPVPGSPYGCQVDRRFSHFMPTHEDRWWKMTTEDEAIAAGAELAEALRLYVLPRLELATTDCALLRAWKTPGLNLSPLGRGDRDWYEEMLTEHLDCGDESV